MPASPSAARKAAATASDKKAGAGRREDRAKSKHDEVEPQHAAPPARAAATERAAEATADMAPIVGANLRRLRKERSLSLEALSRASGVSRAMLGQVELGQSAPTINVLWKISRALGVSFSTLISTETANTTAVMPAARARVLTSHDGAFRSRPLFPSGEPRNVEFYELKLAARAVEEASPHPPGTVENLVVARGVIDLEVGADRHHLETGDAILFEADLPHAYKNSGAAEAVMYLVMTYTTRAR